MEVVQANCLIAFKQVLSRLLEDVAKKLRKLSLRKDPFSANWQKHYEKETVLLLSYAVVYFPQIIGYQFYF